ncbi:MAG: DUF4091 domain-containing protein [Lentisphaeria bacterium]|nr:DUF4091 domain-containing protein [Lentisphaeria bacterium]
MKKIFLLPVLAFMLSLEAAPMLTVIGGKGELKLEQFGLIVKYFKHDKAPDRQEALRICEAIDNSKLVLIYGGIANCENVFKDASVQKAFNNLFSRGGGVYIAIPSWTWMNNRPQSMFKYFASAGINLPTVYRAFPNKQRSAESKPAPEAPAWAKTPNAFFRLSSRGHIGNTFDKKWQKLFTAQGFPTALYREDVMGKGVAVVNFCNTVHINPVSPFLENYITRMYGDRQVGMRRKKSSAAPVSAALPANFKYINLSKENTVELKKAIDAKNPECPTTVKISANNNNLKLHFFCKTDAVEKLKKRHTNRDGAIWQDDCIEVFIADGTKNSSNVHQFVVNVNNALYDAKNSSSQWNCSGIKTEAKTGKDGFEIILEIPFASLNIVPSEKTLFRMNLCREARAGVKSGNYELQSFNPTTSFAVISSMAYAGFTANPVLTSSKNTAKSNGVQIYRTPQFEKIYADFEPPEGTKETEKISMTVARNDKEGTPIVLLNNSDLNLRYRIEPDYYLKNTKYKFQEMVRVKELLPYRAVSKQVFYEIISDLNQAGIVSVPSSDISALYLEFMTALPPGKYQWGFKLIPVNADVPQRRIEVEVEVLDLTMPEKLGLDFYLFGPYLAKQAYYVSNPQFTLGLYDKYMQVMKDYHVTCVHVYDPLLHAIKIKDGKIIVSDNKKDYIFNEKIWQQSGFEWSYHYGIWAIFWGRLKAAKLPATLKNEEVRNAFELAVSRLSKFLKEEGIDFKCFYVPVWDEPRTADIDDVIIASAIVRKYGFRTNQTMANWSTLDDFKRLQDSVDYWIPLEYHVTNDKNSAEILKVIKKNNKKFAPYMCSVGGVVENYHSYFRYRGIKEFIAGADGIMLWAANSYRGNDYDSREDKSMRAMFLFHHGETGPVPTVRFEALREGLEDMYYLRLAEKSSDPEVRKFADKKALSKLMERSNPAEMEKWHADLLKALAK